MSKTFEFSEKYKIAKPHEQILLDAIDHILCEVQYAKQGSRAEARRNASITILETFKEASKSYFKNKHTGKD